MKKFVLYLVFMSSCLAQAQLFIGNSEGIRIVSGTTFTFDGLVMNPSSALNILNNTITYGSTPITGANGSASIARVYSFNQPILYDGVLRINYFDTELNGNVEADLQLYYRNGILWQSGASGSVDQSLNYVANTFAINFEGLTASQLNSVLPLKSNSFTAKLQKNAVHLDWTISENEKYNFFTLAAKTDNQIWKNIAVIPAKSDAGTTTYHFSDLELSFSTKQYRLRLENWNGKITQSPIVLVTNDKRFELLSWNVNNQINLLFKGEKPKNVKIFSSSGQLVWKDATSKYNYTSQSLMKGFYVVVYVSSSGELFSNKIIVR